jgi:predicted AlkP superfamily pyrophosphatase or phosphodiesterase
MLRRTFGMLCLAVVGLLVLSPACDGQAPAKPAVERVILVSIDGLRPDVIAHLGPEKTPTLHRLMKEGAFTLNARTDAQNTSTIPNHTCMITSRPLRGEAGHHY